MAEYVDRFESMFERLATMDAGISDDMQVAIFLSSFSNMKEYDNIISALKTLKAEELTWDKVTARLIEEYKTRKVNGRTSSSRLGSNRLLGANSTAEQQKSRSRHRSKEVSKDLCCFICEEEHFAKNCPYKRELRDFLKQRKGTQKESEKKETHNKPRLGMALSSFSVKSTQVKEGNMGFAGPSEIIVDSGASQHMFCSKGWFSKLEPISSQVVYLANGNTVTCNMKGEVNVHVYKDRYEKPDGSNYSTCYIFRGWKQTLFLCNALEKGASNLSLRREDVPLRTRMRF